MTRITLMNSHHHHRHWLHHSAHVDRSSHELDERRKLIGASHRFGPLHYLQIFIQYLQCIGEQYSANGQRQVIYFRTDDMASTRDWKAIPPARALDINQPTIFFTGEAEDQRPNPVTDRSSGVGPIPGIES